MRSFIASVVATFAVSAQVLAFPRISDVRPQVVTLLLYVDETQKTSTESLQAMKQELRAMLDTAYLNFDFITPPQARPPAYFQTLVSVRMAGMCTVADQPVLQTKGPLAFAHSSDGRILPFIEVSCNRVRMHVRSAFWGSDTDRLEYLYGRALARVLAHELYHVLTGRKEHTTVGITKSALTGAQLIADAYELEGETLDLITTSASLKAED